MLAFSSCAPSGWPYNARILNTDSIGRAALPLTTSDHSRTSAGLTYVYPVLSRRSGGLSIGINLNPNNACNWRCIYCQVPGLQRGAAPAVDLDLLRSELSHLLDDVLHGGFYRRFHVAEEQQAIRDIAISGNGEPTSAADFPDVIEVIAEVAAQFGLGGSIKRVLITNGSLMGRPAVQQGLVRWAEQGGELWFKIDRVTPAGLTRINQVRYTSARLARNLEIAARCCPTWVQSCLFAIDGQPPEETELRAYLDFIEERLHSGLPLRGVLVYGLARPSLQPEAPRLSALPRAWMEHFAERIRQLGLTADVSV